MRLENAVIDDREAGLFQVHRSVWTAPELLDLEYERIFDRTWLYLGHESEIESPGDYVRRPVAGQPLIFIRDSDGQARVFYNTCTHRGALICRQDQGHADVFQCFYHAWSFNTKGELVGLPDEAGYGAGFSRSERALKSPPRLEDYRGLYFVSFDPDIEDLGSYLGEARRYIDLALDQAETGMRILPGSHNYGQKANWKLVIENTGDAYHGMPLHQTFFNYIMSLGGQPRQGFGPPMSRALAFRNGHSVIQFPVPHGRPPGKWGPPFPEDSREDLAAMRARLIERCGQERADEMADLGQILRVYPNFYLVDIHSINLRVHWPVSVGDTDVFGWHMAPREESGARLQRRLDLFLGFYGPGGFGIPDDVEAVESCQTGYRIREVEWSDYSRGMHRTPQSVDDLQTRTFYREWQAQLLGRVADHSETLREPAVAAGG